MPSGVLTQSPQAAPVPATPRFHRSARPSAVAIAVVRTYPRHCSAIRQVSAGIFPPGEPTFSQNRSRHDRTKCPRTSVASLPAATTPETTPLKREGRRGINARSQCDVGTECPLRWLIQFLFSRVVGGGQNYEISPLLEHLPFSQSWLNRKGDPCSRR
jgi:hypothetical protein